MAIIGYTKSDSSLFHAIGETLYIAATSASKVFAKSFVAFEKYQTRSALYRLSARELEDIGISRADIPAVVEEIFLGKK